MPDLLQILWPWLIDSILTRVAPILTSTAVNVKIKKAESELSTLYFGLEVYKINFYSIKNEYLN